MPFDASPKPVKPPPLHLNDLDFAPILTTARNYLARYREWNDFATVHGQGAAADLHGDVVKELVCLHQVIRRAGLLGEMRGDYKLV